MNTETALTTTNPAPVVPGENVELTATAPDEIGQAQIRLIDWCKNRILNLKVEYEELREAYDHAVAQKWKSSTLERPATRCLKRVQFYEKMLSALEHGYCIIPNFPVTVFAIRTDKTKPLKTATFEHWNNHEQLAAGIPAGEGDYKNPFPVQWETMVPNPSREDEKRMSKQYTAEEWADLDFPLNMAKPRIMEATTRAMALKIFDDFGILPGNKKEDPIIVGRLRDPRSGPYRGQTRWVTMMIAWHLNTRDL